MSIAFKNSDAIKHAVYEELQNILSPDTNVRQSAEERLSQLKFTEGYGVYLAEFTMNQSFNLGLRQLAVVMLKKYVEAHWSVNDESQTCDQAKKTIKGILPNGLYDPNSKIRTSVAYTISTIASHDWPNNWMELFGIIVKCLSGNEDSVHGAMQVLVEFTYDLDSQISNVGPIIMSEVYRIFTADSMYSLKTRACAIDIFRSIIKSINAHIQSAEEREALLGLVLDHFIEKMLVCLSLPNGQHSNFLLKTAILKTFCYMLVHMSKYIRPHIETILKPIWALMTQTVDLYTRVVVNDTVESPFPDDADDDEKDNFLAMILHMFEFIHGVIESGKFKGTVKEVVTDLIYIIIIYMQITEAQVETWTQEPEKFVLNEDEQNVDFTIRLSSQDILLNLGQEMKEDVVLPALQEALSRHYCVAEAEKNANNVHWWKIHEACMLAVSCFEFIIEAKGGTNFNLTDYLNASKQFMTLTVSPFLTGRCISLMSEFSSSDIYNPQLLAELLETTSANLAADKSIVIRLCSARAIHNFCENLRDASAEKRAVVVAKLGTFYDGISLIGLEKPGTLNILLESLYSIVSFDERFTASIQSRIIPLAITVLLKQHEDRNTLELVLDLIKVLCRNKFCLGALQERLIPTLVNVLNYDKDQGKAMSMQSRAFDVLQAIVCNCEPPLNDALMESAFVAAVQCILRTDDQTVMESGARCLRAYVHVAPEQVCKFRNGAGLAQIMQITTLLLNPMNTDAPSVGELVVTLISKAGNYLDDNIYLLLKAVISKMQIVLNWDFANSLILIFAHLFLIQMNGLLDFLTTVPGPSGEPAIAFIFSSWLSRHASFYGVYMRKLSLLALCKVFEYGVTSKDVRLTSVNMKVVITSPEATVRTRSQYANAQQVILVPILVRILQILLQELVHLKEMELANRLRPSDDVDTDDEESPNDSAKEGEMDSIGVAYSTDGDEDDEDDDPLLKEILSDPILQSDIDLTKFMQNFSLDGTFMDFLVHLNESEKDVLRSIQVNV